MLGSGMLGSGMLGWGNYDLFSNRPKVRKYYKNQRVLKEKLANRFSDRFPVLLWLL